MQVDELRPTRLDGYIGQAHIKEPLSVVLISAKARGAPLPHIILSGPPGLGKTTLSLILAQEMGWPMEELIASTAGTPKELSLKLMFLKQPTMFFIDEIHGLRAPVQEVLYPVLEDGKVLYRGPNGSNTVDLVPLTMVGATTHIGKLTQPFIDRFQLQFELQFYGLDELNELGSRSAKKLELDIDTWGLEAISNRSRGTPRYTNNYLRWIRDYKIFLGKKAPKVIDEEFVVHILWDKLKIDSDGLLPLDRRYLAALADEEKPIGLEALASQLRQQEVTLENTVEPFLLYSGFIARTGNGRQITEDGREHLAMTRRK